jgi:RNA polymerase sigma-70 factor, ECF subfamily
VSSEPDRLLSILDKHGAELYALLTRLTLRADVAGDLLQDLFVKLKDADGLRRANNPKAYVFRAAIHLAFDWRRQRRLTEPLTGDVADAESSPLDRLIDSEEMEQIVEGMQQLSPLAREIMVLRYLQHEEYAGIADQVGKTEHQVRALCAKAIGQLRNLLQPAPGKSQK